MSNSNPLWMDAGGPNVQCKVRGCIGYIEVRYMLWAGEPVIKLVHRGPRGGFIAALYFTPDEFDDLCRSVQEARNRLQLALTPQYTGEMKGGPVEHD